MDFDIDGAMAYLGSRMSGERGDTGVEREATVAAEERANGDGDEQAEGAIVETIQKLVRNRRMEKFRQIRAEEERFESALEGLAVETERKIDAYVRSEVQKIEENEAEMMRSLRDADDHLNSISNMLKSAQQSLAQKWALAKKAAEGETARIASDAESLREQVRRDFERGKAKMDELDRALNERRTKVEKADAVIAKIATLLESH